ncbi:MAG: hypothetical protein ACJ70Y_02525 [Nitrososphaera sp.]
MLLDVSITTEDIKIISTFIHAFRFGTHACASLKITCRYTELGLGAAVTTTEQQ